MRSNLFGVILLSAICFTIAMSLRGEQLPQISGESLSGKPISLPFASAGSVAIICVGFSHASESQLKPWAERARNEFRQERRVTIYSVAVLEDAPRIFRGLAVRAIKSAIPAQQHDGFVVVYRGERELKQITGFQRPEEAYVLLVDPTGEIQWRGHGPVTDQVFQALTNRAHSILHPK
jgi:ATP10 protein